MSDKKELVFLYDKEGNKVACPIDVVKHEHDLTEEEKELCRDAIITQTDIKS